MTAPPSSPCTIRRSPPALPIWTPSGWKALTRRGHRFPPPPHPDAPRSANFTPPPHTPPPQPPRVERLLCGHLPRSIQCRFGGTLASTCPSPAHQVALDLRADGPDCFVLEPPGYQLHL